MGMSRAGTVLLAATGAFATSSATAQADNGVCESMRAQGSHPKIEVCMWTYNYAPNKLREVKFTVRRLPDGGYAGPGKVFFVPKATDQFRDKIWGPAVANLPGQTTTWSCRSFGPGSAWTAPDPCREFTGNEPVKMNFVAIRTNTSGVTIDSLSSSGISIK